DPDKLFFRPHARHFDGDVAIVIGNDAGVTAGFGIKRHAAIRPGSLHLTTYFAMATDVFLSAVLWSRIVVFVDIIVVVRVIVFVIRIVIADGFFLTHSVH